MELAEILAAARASSSAGRRSCWGSPRAIIHSINMALLDIALDVLDVPKDARNACYEEFDDCVSPSDFVKRVRASQKKASAK